MPDKSLLLALLLALSVAAILLYEVLARSAGSRAAARTALPERLRSSPLQVPERRASSGLAWSKRAYPDQYVDSNRRGVDLSGLDDYENERFLDIGGRAYSREFVSRFSYTDANAMGPQVRLEYLRRAETFIGRLTGQGLKPNFAYQLKLRGIFSDRAASERMGRLGRWRLPGHETNYTDAAYERFPDKQLVESYLFFDFVVTDSDGNVEKEFYADSSLHVSWNLTHQRMPSMADTFPIEFYRAGSDPAIYASPRPDLSPQKLFAESEENARSPHNRPPVGRAFLPVGMYNAEFVLTEESFHGFGDNGYWATVMSAPVEFEVVQQPRPSPNWTAGAPVGDALALERAATENLEHVTRREGCLEGVAASKEPAVVFDEEFHLPADERYFLAAEILAAGVHTWQLFVDNGGGFEKKPTYSIGSRGGKGWYGFEVEVTGAVAGKTARIRLVPALKQGRVGVRNVRLGKITMERIEDNSH